MWISTDRSLIPGKLLNCLMGFIYLRNTTSPNPVLGLERYIAGTGTFM